MYISSASRPVIAPFCCRCAVNSVSSGVVACAHVTAVVAAAEDHGDDDGDMTTQATMPFHFPRPARDLAPAVDQYDAALTDDDGDFETEVCLRRLTDRLGEM